MDSEVHDEHPPRNATEPARSDRSLEFEAFWRALPKMGLVPHRRDVRPGLAPSLLRDMVMLEAHLGDRPALRVRLIGSGIQDRIQKDITGADYLDFRPGNKREETIEFVHLMTIQPCGFWQTMPMHYARGFAQNFELTAFPLLGDDVPLILGLMRPLGGLVRALPLDNQPILADTAITLQFIDIGAGKPAWHAPQYR